MAILALKILKDLTHQIETDQLVLPTLPEVALKAREVAEDPNATSTRLAKVIGNDVALAARIIKVANSPIMRASRKVEDLGMAINRLGTTFTSNLVTGLAMEQMFQATSDVIDKIMRATWARSTDVAGIATVLCRAYTKLRPDQATLGALVHRIGALPILTYAEEHAELANDPFTLNKIIDDLHGQIGSVILKHWDFPDELRDIPSAYLSFDRRSPKLDYVDIVQVANLQTYVGTNHRYCEMDWSKIPAFGQLGLDPNNPQDLENLSEDMAAAMSLLK
jgi:HD-like signal output (HDOD) protein